MNPVSRFGIASSACELATQIPELIGRWVWNPLEKDLRTVKQQINDFRDTVKHLSNHHEKIGDADTSEKIHRIIQHATEALGDLSKVLEDIESESDISGNTRRRLSVSSDALRLYGETLSFASRMFCSTVQKRHHLYPRVVRFFFTRRGSLRAIPRADTRRSTLPDKGAMSSSFPAELSELQGPLKTDLVLPCQELYQDTISTWPKDDLVFVHGLGTMASQSPEIPYNSNEEGKSCGRYTVPPNENSMGICEKLLADDEHTPVPGITPLQAAATTGRLNICNKLLEDGANTPVPGGGFIPPLSGRFGLQLTLGGTPLLAALLVGTDITMVWISGMCAWSIREYDMSLGPLRTSDGVNLPMPTAREQQLLLEQRIPHLAKLFERPLLPVLAFAFLYTSSVSTIYCLHRHDRHLNTALGLGGCVATAAGLLQGIGIKGTLVQLVPGAVVLSLLLSALFHGVFIARMERHRCYSREFIGLQGSKPHPACG